MMNKLNLMPNESIILKSDGVMHRGVLSVYTDELILTNRNIIYINKGLFRNTKNIQRFPINQIKMHNGEPQVLIGKSFNGQQQLEIYFKNGSEIFCFQNSNKKEISKWINAIYKLLTGHESTKKSIGNSTGIPGSEFLAETIKGTVDNFRNVFGTDKSGKSIPEVKITCKCISCSAPITGVKGQTIHCKYCDTDQVL